MSGFVSATRPLPLILASAIAMAVAPLPAAAQLSLLGQGPASLAPLVRAVAPAVVGITVTEANGQAPAVPTPVVPGPSGALRDKGKTIRPFTPPSLAAGSGFIIGRDGSILTNDHVIKGAAAITVTLNDGTELPAHLVAADDLTDLAVIRIRPPHALSVVRWGDSAHVAVGDWVLVAGNPFALGNSFTVGIVSAEGRNIGDGPFDHFLQLDAPINPGNSGGPAFDLTGRVIGINTAIVSPSGGSVGIGFAIPSDAARQVATQLAGAGGMTRGWLGISVADAAGGARITAVEADGPADDAGLQPGDLVRSVGGTPVAGAAALVRAIATLPPGQHVSLGVSRNGHILKLGAVVVRRPAELGD